MASEDSTAGRGDNDPNAVVRQALGAEEDFLGVTGKESSGSGRRPGHVEGEQRRVSCWMVCVSTALFTDTWTQADCHPPHHHQQQMCQDSSRNSFLLACVCACDITIRMDSQRRSEPHQ